MKLAALCVLALSTTAYAGGDDANVLVGPVIGLAWTSHTGWTGLFGVEGGGGVGPERLNVGFVDRSHKLAGYLELDPWLLVGGSLGLAIDEDAEPHLVLGIWEGLPVGSYHCGDGEWHRLVTISAGIRWTGSLEIYFAPKAGAARNGCID